jgi:hypothetical protein
MTLIFRRRRNLNGSVTPRSSSHHDKVPSAFRKSGGEPVSSEPSPNVQGNMCGFATNVEAVGEVSMQWLQELCGEQQDALSIN